MSDAACAPVPVPVPLPKAYRLLNHGPTVLVTAAHGGRRNVMAAAWSVPLDFDPPRLAVVIDRSTYTRGLVEASGAFALNVPCVAQVEAVTAAGSLSGRDFTADAAAPDKFAACGLATFAASVVEAPLVAGCVAWLECRVRPDAAAQQRDDLFVAEVVAAAADPRVFGNGRWHFDAAPDALRTLHHVAGGHYLAIGAAVDGNGWRRGG